MQILYEKKRPVDGNNANLHLELVPESGKTAQQRRRVPETRHYTIIDTA